MERDFKAVFNPYNKQLFVKYGETKEEYQFTDLCEWIKVYHDNNEDFLHIHLDYDEYLQLIFYYVPSGQVNTDNRYYNDCQGWYTINKPEDEIFKYLTIVKTDSEYKEQVEKLS